MRLYWTLRGIPHCYLGATPIHLIYRVRDCAPVKELKLLRDDLRFELKGLRRQRIVDREAIHRVLEEHAVVYDALLDAQDQSKYVLADERAARVVIESWQTLRERGLILLYAVCVMGNHVHVLLRGGDGRAEAQIGALVRKHKSFTNAEVRKAISSETKVWDSGFYDRYVRPGTFWEVLRYVLHNPQAAKLVRQWRDWPCTYVDDKCLEEAKRRGIVL